MSKILKIIFSKLIRKMDCKHSFYKKPCGYTIDKINKNHIELYQCRKCGEVLINEDKRVIINE